MKYITLIFIIFFITSCNHTTTPVAKTQLSSEQISQIKKQWSDRNIIGSYFHTYGILGISADLNADLNLIPTDTTNEYAGYGNSIIFNEDMTISNSYAAPCGNDCFPYSHGTYQIIDSTSLNIVITEVGQYGMCDEYKKTVNKNLGLYKLTVVTDTLVLFKKLNS